MPKLLISNYYNGGKQYLELDTRYVFVSVANEDAVNRAFTANNGNQIYLRNICFCFYIYIVLQP